MDKNPFIDQLEQRSTTQIPLEQELDRYSTGDIQLGIKQVVLDREFNSGIKEANSELRLDNYCSILTLTGTGEGSAPILMATKERLAPQLYY